MTLSVPNKNKTTLAPLLLSSKEFAMNNNGDDILEPPTWQNDQVMIQNIAQSSSNEFDVPKYDTNILANHNHNYYQLQQQQQQNLYMQEDEMTSWLHNPFPDTNFCSNFSEGHLLYPSSSTAFTDTKMASCEMNVTSSSGDVMIPQNSCDDPKRKGKEKELECHTKLKSAEAKKRAHGSSKKSRVAEVHNQSERRRRDRINQKLKALRELIPCSDKLDKASMLEEAIKYMKSLQMQVQMMSMGYNMVPGMFPGVQQYVPLMVMGLNRPILPLPNVLTDASLTTPRPVATGTTHLDPSFAISPYQITPITSPNSSITQSPCVSKC